MHNDPVGENKRKQREHRQNPRFQHCSGVHRQTASIPQEPCAGVPGWYRSQVEQKYAAFFLHPHPPQQQWWEGQRGQIDQRWRGQIWWNFLVGQDQTFCGDLPQQLQSVLGESTQFLCLWSGPRKHSHCAQDSQLNSRTWVVGWAWGNGQKDNCSFEFLSCWHPDCQSSKHNQLWAQHFQRGSQKSVSQNWILK